MGLSELEDLRRRCTELEELYNEAVKARDEAIEERDKATVLIALQLQNETEQLNDRIADLQSQNGRLQHENDDLKLRLDYAKDDLNKLQQRHIQLQIEQERWIKRKEEAPSTKEVMATYETDTRDEDISLGKEKDPAYSHIKHDILHSADEEDLELESRPPVTLKTSRPEDFFDVHDELGKGKFGVVKRVTEKSTQKVFAAKYIRLGSRDSGSSRDDIMREIDIMNQLHHKRLVGLIDAFDMSKHIVMVMEFISGGELFERVADADSLTEKEASYYMHQLLQGLQYMHKKHIVHLDLKPENIVCVSKESWDIKLIDFGLAQELKAGVRMKGLKGTPEFMAPEAVNFEPISLSTDMWSVGVIAYILLSGLSPLLGDDDSDTLANVTAAEWDFDDDSFDVISDDAKDFISNLLVKNPRKRNSVHESLKHDWMKMSASANAVKIDTKKLKHFLAKRRWQKSVNALVAVRRLSSLTTLMNPKGGSSGSPSLATVALAEEEEDAEAAGAEADDLDATGKEVASDLHGSDDEDEHDEEKNIAKRDQEPQPSAKKSLSKSANTDKEDQAIDSSISVPVFTKELTNITASERDTVTLEVTVSGACPYELEWFKNAVDITESERISLISHDDGRFSLVIRECDDDDSGEYCCVAQNEAGRVTCAGWLTVEENSKSEGNGNESGESEDEENILMKEFVEIREGDVQTYYCIEEEVGRGRFGIVRKCVELDTATRFCAKFIKSRPSQKAEFKREIDAMNTLHHPRLIRLYDAFEEPRQIILIMEYARGGDLFSRIDGDSLPECEAVKILRQVLEGLKFMHDNNFMHLDLKPQNVMFKNEGGSTIKLIDFSLTRKFDPEQETKTSFGTAEYVAPEILNYEPVTFAADMWATGVMAYMMLTGDSPFLGPSQAETFSRITDARWEFTDVFDYVSKEAKDFIKRLLLKDPRQRLTVDECFDHDWIVGELALDENSNIVSHTQRKRQVSKIIEEQETPIDVHKLKAKLWELQAKLHGETKAREELEIKLREEEERADTLEDELCGSQNSVQKFEENVSKLEKKNVELEKRARMNSDVLKRVAQTEGEKQGLKDLLDERTKFLETLTLKYDSLKEKLESYDILEDKVYLLERERKELREGKQYLESKLESYEEEKSLLLEENQKNDMTRKEFEKEILTIREERDDYENKYTNLRQEKESMVEKLTKQFYGLEQQKQELTQEKVQLKTNLDIVKSENDQLKDRLLKLTKEAAIKNDSGEKDNSEIKTQKEEMQKTCENQASKMRNECVELEHATSHEKKVTDGVDLQQEINLLRESCSSLKRERNRLKEELDDRETQIEQLKKKSEQLENDNNTLTKERNKLSLDYNTAIAALQQADDSTKKENLEDSAARENSESPIEIFPSEGSSVQEKLAVFNQTSKVFEEKVNSNGEFVAFISHANHSAADEDSVFAESADQLSNTPSSLPEGSNRGELEIRKENQVDIRESGFSRMSRSRQLNESESLWKKNFEDLKKFSQELNSNLKREREKTKTLEDALENLEVEKRRGIMMYRELEDELDQLRRELEDIKCSQSEVRLQELLNTRLNAQDDKTDVLRNQVNPLKKEVQSFEEERDSGNTMYSNLTEKYKNLLKEKKHLELENLEHDQKEEKLRELEEFLKARILELLDVKNENECARERLLVLEREKEEGDIKFASLENDYVKLVSDCKELQRQIDEERHRGEILTTERAVLQKTLHEIQSDLKQRDLVAAANEKTVEMYALENKALKDEKEHQLNESERLKKEHNEMLEDLKELKKIKEETNSLVHERDRLLKEAELSKKENRALLQDREELNETRIQLKCLKDDRFSFSKELESLKKEKQSLLDKLEKLKTTGEDVNALKCEKERALEETRKLKQENEVIVRGLEDFRITKQDFDVLYCEKEQSSEEVRKLKLEKDALISNLQELETIREALNVLRCEKEDAHKEKQRFQQENEALAVEIETVRKANENFNTRLVSSSEDNQRLKKKCKELEESLENQVLVAMKLKKESTALTNKVGLLTKEMQRRQKERPPREIGKFPEYKPETGGKYEKEIEFLQKEVEDLTEEKIQLLKAYNVLKGEMVCLKVELSCEEKCLEPKSCDLLIEERNLEEKRRTELEDELKIVSEENQKISTDLRNVTEDFDSQTQRLALALQEIQDITAESEETHKNFLNLEEKYIRIRKINRELEEDIEIEIGKLAQADAHNKELSQERTDLRLVIKDLEAQFEKSQSLSKISDCEQAELTKKVQRLEKKKAKYKASKKELEIQLADEKSRNENFDAQKKKLEDLIGRLKEEVKDMKREYGRTVSALEIEFSNLRPLKERVNTLEKEGEQLREKLNSKAEEIELKKKENDSLMYELESMRHRLVSNVLNPLEGACNFRVNAADIYAGKIKAWSHMKEGIVALIRDRENLKTAISSLEHAWSGMKERNPAAKTAWNQVAATRKENLQIVDETDGNAADKPESYSRKETPLCKELEVLHGKIDDDEKTMEAFVKEKKQQELPQQLQRIEKVPLTADFDRSRPAVQRGLFSPMENKAGPPFLSEVDFQSLKTMERISVAERHGGRVGLETRDTSPQRELTSDWAENEQLKVARELVRRNREIFELEQMMELLLKGSQSSTAGNVTEKEYAELESTKEEILRLQIENQKLKELENVLSREIDGLKAEGNALRDETEDLLREISTKHEKISALETQVQELTQMKSCTGNGIESGKRVESNETEERMKKCDRELRIAKQRELELEAEVDRLNTSFNAKKKRELDKIETKWAERLRKECIELQCELSQRHNKEKQLWLKKEVELQNIIRQMKIVMDKRFGQAESERRRLEQQLMWTRNPRFHGSVMSVNSNSDESAKSPSLNPGTSSDVTANDCVSDRELRRVACKLNGEEWSRLGTFLGVGERDLLQLSDLNMGPQEKAFRLLCMWRTRCLLSRAQMISQLAVSLEEVERKDLAQFVLEQFMSGKPRKKLFGW